MQKTWIGARTNTHTRQLYEAHGTPLRRNDLSSRDETELLMARTPQSKCRSGCWLASILPPRAGPPDLGFLRPPAADHGSQQLLGSGGGNSALAPL